MASERNVFERALFREIHKNTWLNKVSTTTNLKKKKERTWVVFCVHDDTDAYLELYTNNAIAVMHKPDQYISLNNVQHISPTICAREQEYEFVLSFENEVITLAAPTWDQMLDWVSSLRDKLYELRILNPKENVYTKLPDVRGGPLLSTRDPTSPLPLPPSVTPVVLPGTELLTPAISIAITTYQRSTSQQSSSSSNMSSSSTTREQISSEQNPTTTTDDELSFHVVNITINDHHDHDESSSNDLPPTSYEYLFNSADDNSGAGGSSSTRTTIIRHDDDNNSSLLLQLDCVSEQQYKTLREQQVLELQKEIKHPYGIKIQLSRRDCLNSIALVDAFNSIWVCGWKQKEYPMHYNVLHIGDQLLSINGRYIRSVAEAHSILKSHHYRGRIVEIVIKRIPHGQVYMIRRETDGQSLGIIQKNNSAVIATIEANSLASRYGLTSEAPTYDGLTYTSWVITEINGRPLNLFYKKNQVRDRLNSVGREISILVQPLDVIKQLKKQLKSLRNYKDYVLE